MKDSHSKVAVILAVTIGLTLLVVAVLTFGPWTDAPTEEFSGEILALIAAGLGALSTYIGLDIMNRRDHRYEPKHRLDEDAENAAEPDEDFEGYVEEDETL